MDSPTLLADLRNLLVELYPDEPGARRIAADAGLAGAHIGFSRRALDNWHAILGEAAKSDKIDALLQMVHNDYPTQTRLRDLWMAYQRDQAQRSDHGLRAASPRPAIRATGLAAPLPATHFFGRDQDLAALTDRLVRGERLAVWGLAGMGKSALAVALLDQPALAAAFPQWRVGLALGLHGDAFTLLGHALSTLGVEPSALTNVETRSVQLRTLLAQRQLFWLVDDVWSIEQVQPLLAACSPTTGLLLTTRLPLLADELGLAAYPLAPLAPDPAHELLAAAGSHAAQAVAADPATTNGLLTYLGRLPLALHVVGRRLNQLAHADGPAQAVAQLYQTLQTKRATLLRLRAATPRLGLVDVQPELAAALALSYDALPTDGARHAFCQLAVFGPEPRDFDAAALRAVWDADDEGALAWRLALTEAGLLTRQSQTTGPTRYSVHQLLHTFAEEHLAATPGAVHTTTLAHARYYAAIVAEWTKGLFEETMTISEPTEWVQTTAAFDWLTVQMWPTSASTAVSADERAASAAVLLTCAQHWRNVIYNNHDPRRIRWLQAAAQAADQYGDPWDQANVQKAQGDVLAFLDQREEALAKYAQALTLFEQVGDRLGQANAFLSIGDLERATDNYQAAWNNYEQAYQLYTAIGDRYSIARALNVIGDWQAEQENRVAANNAYQQAISLLTAVGLSDLAAQVIGPKLARMAGAASAADTGDPA